MGIDDMLNRYKGCNATQQHINVDTNDKALGKLLNIYSDWINKIDRVPAVQPNIIRSLKDVLITPYIISKFCLELKQFESERFFDQSGFYITAMIQKSFNDGENCFLVPISHLKDRVSFIGYHLFGRKFDHIDLMIKGRCGEYCGAGSRYLDILFDGHAGRGSACEVRDSSVIYKDRTEFISARHSQDSKFVFEGHADVLSGAHSQRCHFTFKNSVDEWVCDYAEYSSICSPKMSVLRNMKDHCKMYQCNFYLIEDNKEIEVTQWD